MRCTYLRHTDDDLARQIVLLREAISLHEAVSSAPMIGILAGDVLGETLYRAGAFEQAECTVRAGLALAEEVGSARLTSHAQLALANIRPTEPTRTCETRRTAWRSRCWRLPESPPGTKR